MGPKNWLMRDLEDMMAQFGVYMRQNVEEVLAELRKEASRRHSEVHGRLEEKEAPLVRDMESMRSHIQQLTRLNNDLRKGALDNELSRLREATKEAVGDMRELKSRVVEEVRNLTGEFANLKRVVDLQQEKLNGLRDKVESTVLGEMFQAQCSANDLLAEVSKDLRGLSARHEELSQQRSDASEAAAEKAEGHFEKLQTMMQDLGSELAQVHDTTDVMDNFQKEELFQVVKDASEEKAKEVWQRMHVEVSEKISLLSLDFPMVELRSCVREELDGMLRKSGLGTTPTTHVFRLLEQNHETQLNILQNAKTQGEWWTELRKEMEVYSEDCAKMREKMESTLSKHKAGHSADGGEPEESDAVDLEVLKQIRLVERRGNTLVTLTGCGDLDPFVEVVNLPFAQKKPPAVPKSHEMFGPNDIRKADEIFEDVVALSKIVPANLEVEIHAKEDKKMKKYNENLGEERGRAIIDGLVRNGLAAAKQVKVTKVLDTPRNLNRPAVLIRFQVHGPKSPS